MDDIFFKLLFIFIIIFLVNKKDWTSPSVVFSISFVVSGLIFLLNSKIWNYELSKNTETVILGGVTIFFVGSFLGGFVPVKESKRKEIDQISISDDRMKALCAFCLLLPLFRVFDIILVTGSFNIFGGLGDYREREVSSFFGKLISIIGPICNAIIMIMIVIILNNHFENKKIKKSYYFPIIYYFIASALSSSRIDVIYMFIDLVFIYLFVYRIKTNSSIKFKQLKYVFLAAVILGGTFFGLGFMTGKSQKQESATAYLSMYAASSFGALDYYLEGFHYNKNNIGQETFVGVANMLSWVGVEKDNYVGKSDIEFVALGDMTHSTNVYTCFRPLIHDYNYIGMYLILFLEGFLFQIFYKKTKADFARGGVLWLSFYTYMLSYLIISSVAERIFSCLLTLTTLMFVISLAFLKRIVRIDYKSVTQISNNI